MHFIFVVHFFFFKLLTLRRRVAIVFPNSPFLSKLDIPRIALSYQKWDSRHIMWCPGGSLLKTALSKPRSYIEYKCVFSLPLLLHSSNNKRTPSFYDAPAYPCVNKLFLPWYPFVFWNFSGFVVSLRMQLPLMIQFSMFKIVKYQTSLREWHISGFEFLKHSLYRM